MPVGGRGVSPIERFVSDGAYRVVGCAPDLSQSEGAEAAGQSRIGKSSAWLAGICGADNVLKLVHRGEPIADFVRAPDAPARAATRVDKLGIGPVLEQQSAAQRTVPGGFGENN